MVRILSTASLSVTVLLSAASLASAADALISVQQVSTPSWTGFYLGVHGGGAFGNMGYDQLPVLSGDTTRSYDFGDENFAYGVHGGFDYQFSNRWLAGFELDYTQLGSDYSPFESGGFGTLVKADSMYSVSGRAGYLVTPQTLFYGRAGYGAIKLEAEEGFFDTATKTVGMGEFGVGVETFLYGNLTARFEASYFRAINKFTIDSDAESFDPRYFLVTAGLNYRFNAQNESAYPAEPPQDTKWDGIYAGVDGSYNFAVMHLDVDVPGATVGPFGAETLGGGVFAGYNFVLGSSYLLGVEAGAEYLDARFEDPAQNSFDPDAPTRFGTVKAQVSVTGRAGYFVSPSTVVYGKGGFAGLLTEANDEYFGLDGGGSKMLSAYQFGAGTEAALTERIRLRIEGLYTKAVSGLTVSNSQLDQNELKPSLLTGKVGLAYQF